MSDKDPYFPVEPVDLPERPELVEPPESDADYNAARLAEAVKRGDIEILGAHPENGEYALVDPDTGDVIRRGNLDKEYFAPMNDQMRVHEFGKQDGQGWGGGFVIGSIAGFFVGAIVVGITWWLVTAPW